MAFLFIQLLFLPLLFHPLSSASATGSSQKTLDRSFKFDHIGLSVADITAQVQFYSGIMGFHDVVDNFTIQAPETVHVVKLQNKEGVMIELINNMISRRVENITNPIDGSRYQGYFHCALRVANVEESFTYLTKAGTGARGVVSPSPNVSGGGRYAYVADPEGNLIELIERGGSRRRVAEL